MIPSAILGRYSRSLAEIAFEGNLQQTVWEDLQSFAEIFRAVPDLLDVFHAPSIPRETKEKLLAELMAKYPVNTITSNFLRILLQHHRIRYFQQIADGYLKAMNDRKGIVSAQVTAASPLSQEQLKALEEKLAGMTGKFVQIESQTDANLLGGVVVQMGSTIFDGSIRTQLSEMKRRLTEKY
ncbi:MAG TPA: ATP synthase F1 subunit delta [Acidobacteriota bacterium]|nr:ATP synthase F1 subunit delta [Acidobacteriota bacterium]